MSRSVAVGGSFVHSDCIKTQGSRGRRFFCPRPDFQVRLFVRALKKVSAAQQWKKFSTERWPRLKCRHRPLHSPQSTRIAHNYRSKKRFFLCLWAKMLRMNDIILDWNLPEQKDCAKSAEIKFFPKISACVLEKLFLCVCVCGLKDQKT